MTGSKSRALTTHSLDVFIGSDRKIATLTIPEGSEREISLEYESSWVQNGFPISPHLPFHSKLSVQAVNNYLQNLLPEGQGLEDITSNTTISKNNTFGLIRVIGEETSGALSFKQPAEEPTRTTFRPIENTELAGKLDRYKKHAEPIIYWDGQARLSVAGVQDKLNVLEHQGKFGFGEGRLCSNKIVKFETGKAPFIAVNELFTITLAHHSGIDVPKVGIRSFGSVRAFIIDRFDRHYDKATHTVKRRHVIDGCQATNLPPSYKYERQYGDQGDGKYIRDGVSFPRLFTIPTVNDEIYRLKLLQWMTFNILVRNYDAHGKNISFFVGKQGLELTPFYDLVNIEAILIESERLNNHKKHVEPLSGRNYAMSIGEYEAGTEGNFQHPFTAYMLADFAQSFSISIPRIQLVMEQIIKRILHALETSRAEVVTQQVLSTELEHVDLCISIIKEAATELLAEIKKVPDMARLL